MIRTSPLSRRVLFLALMATVLWPAGVLAVGPAHSAEHNVKSCTSITKTDVSRVAIIKSFLVPLGASYNIGDWPSPSKQNSNYKWIDEEIVLDEKGYHKTGQMLSGQSFALFGSRAGPSWVVFNRNNTVMDLSAALSCSGYKVQPIEGALLRPNVWRAQHRKQNDFLGVETDNYVAVCLLPDATSPSQCQYDDFAPMFQTFSKRGK